jgi:fatty-acyl-CoA synthase
MIRPAALHAVAQGRTADVEESTASTAGYADALQDLLCRRSDVRYAVIVPDPDTGTRIATVLSWPGQTADIAGCLDAITGAFGPSVASTVVVLPVDWIPLTEQGKPNRPEIRELAAATGR